MGATNSTLHYQLSQFISTDKPAWLQDYNGDMQKIDTGINGALTAAESAQNSADSASSGVSTLSDSVSALATTVSGHTSDITDLAGDVNTIESLIGNGTPTAGDHTLIGAINANTNDIASSGIWKTHVENSAGTTSTSQRAVTLPTDWHECMIEVCNHGGSSTTDGSVPTSQYHLVKKSNDAYLINGYYISTSNFMRQSCKYSAQYNTVTIAEYNSAGDVIPGYISVYYK